MKRENRWVETNLDWVKESTPKKGSDGWKTRKEGKEGKGGGVEGRSQPIVQHSLPTAPRMMRMTIFLCHLLDSFLFGYIANGSYGWAMSLSSITALLQFYPHSSEEAERCNPDGVGLRKPTLGEVAWAKVPKWTWTWCCKYECISADKKEKEMAQVVFFLFVFWPEEELGGVSKDGVAARDEVERKRDEMSLWLSEVIFGVLTTKVGRVKVTSVWYRRCVRN